VSNNFQQFGLPSIGEVLGWYPQESYELRFDGTFDGHSKLELVPQGRNKGTPAEDMWLRRKHGGWYPQESYELRFDGTFDGHSKLELVPQGRNKGTPAEDMWLRRKHGFYEDFNSSVVRQLILESIQSSSGSPYSGLKGE
jgi:hypothetical protein